MTLAPPPASLRRPSIQSEPASQTCNRSLVSARATTDHVADRGEPVAEYISSKDRLARDDAVVSDDAPAFHGMRGGDEHKTSQSGPAVVRMRCDRGCLHVARVNPRLRLRLWPHPL